MSKRRIGQINVASSPNNLGARAGFASISDMVRRNHFFNGTANLAVGINGSALPALPDGGRVVDLRDVKESVPALYYSRRTRRHVPDALRLALSLERCRRLN
jgi:hypothetical protein